MADNTTAFEDIEFTAPASQEIVTVPEDDYILEAVGFKTVDKPESVLDSEALKKKKPVGELDPAQWEWLWMIAEGEYAGTELKDWTTRIWHEKSTAGKYAAALAGLEKYDRNDMIARGYPTTRSLMGLRLKATVVEVANSNGVMRNYINNPRRLPVARPRPQRPAQATTEPAVPYQEVDDPLFSANFQPVER